MKEDNAFDFIHSKSYNVFFKNGKNVVLTGDVLTRAFKAIEEKDVRGFLSLVYPDNQEKTYLSFRVSDISFIQIIDDEKDNIPKSEKAVWFIIGLFYGVLAAVVAYGITSFLSQ